MKTRKEERNSPSNTEDMYADEKTNYKQYSSGYNDSGYNEGVCYGTERLTLLYNNKKKEACDINRQCLVIDI